MSFRRLFLVVSVCLVACELAMPAQNIENNNNNSIGGGSAASDDDEVYDEVDEPEEEEDDNVPEFNLDLPQPSVGGDAYFKVPLLPGYDWEVTQSWKWDCQSCNALGYDEVHGDYCSGTHTHDQLQYSWDFSLPGSADEGLGVPATADGRVKRFGDCGAMGYCVELEHQYYGEQICSRYSHLKPYSTSHLYQDQEVCQGFVIGEIGGSPLWFETQYVYEPHLHFEFFDCDSGESVQFHFTDGNRPFCTIGEDIYEDGEYVAMQLSNHPKAMCGAQDYQVPLIGGETWFHPACGDIVECPMNRAVCDRSWDHDHRFSDDQFLTDDERTAAQYLWSECALEGKADGALHPGDFLTRAEALKIPLNAYGLMWECEDPLEDHFYENFSDVGPGDWFYDLVKCGVGLFIIDPGHDLFRGNEFLSFLEAAKLIGAAAERSIYLQARPLGKSSFPNVPQWARRHVELIYDYGGFDLGEVDIFGNITRGQYIRMVTALSHCFCPNVDCAGGCACDQQSMSCNSVFAAAGGGIPDDDSADGGSLFVDEEAGLMDLSCWVADGLTSCGEDGDTRLTHLRVKCDGRNQSDQNLEVLRVDVSMWDANLFEPCQRISDPWVESSLSGIPVSLASGDQLEFAGNAEITCTGEPNFDELDVVLSVEVLGDDNRRLWHYYVDEEPIYIGDVEFCE